jgi:hypothetical protein
MDRQRDRVEVHDGRSDRVEVHDGRSDRAEEDDRSDDRADVDDAPHVDEAHDVEDAATRWERRLQTPALVAALASVPAVFLTLAEGAVGTTGRVLDLASASVLVAEAVIPLLVAHDRRAWIRRHRWLLAMVAVVLPAVILAVGPAQLLRLVRTVGAIRLLRVRRIVQAGRVASERLGLTARWRRVTVGLVSVLAAAFVAVILADPTSTSGGFARRVLDAVGPVGVIAAGAVLAGATYLVVRDSRDDDRDNGGPDADGHDGRPDDGEPDDGEPDDGEPDDR